jgi:hypothetical protein
VIDRGDGRPVNPDTLSSGWATFVRKKGLPPVRFHDLRHAHATLMLSKGILKGCQNSDSPRDQAICPIAAPWECRSSTCCSVGCSGCSLAHRS